MAKFGTIKKKKMKAAAYRAAQPVSYTRAKANRLKATLKNRKTY